MVSESLLKSLPIVDQRKYSDAFVSIGNFCANHLAGRRAESAMYFSIACSICEYFLCREDETGRTIGDELSSTLDCVIDNLNFDGECA